MIRTLMLICLLLATVAMGLAAGDASTLWQLESSAEPLQLEYGGPLVGLEHHRGRAVPSRISFFSPRANSLDLSTDYWTRDSAPTVMQLFALHNGELDSIGMEACSLAWTPHRARFYPSLPGGGSLSVDYRFAAQLPVLCINLRRRALPAAKDTLEIELRVAAELRSSHAWRLVTPTETGLASEEGAAWAGFDDSELDSAALVLASLTGRGRPRLVPGEGAQQGKRWLALRIALAPSDSVQLLLLSARGPSWRSELAHSRASIHDELRAWEDRVQAAVADTLFALPPASEMGQALRWARATMEATRHELHGRRWPMPCPAQYNFFFTHDMLVTHLATAQFDPATVATDLEALASLAGEQVKLAHAHYWRGDSYITEWAGRGNWNHLWLPLVAGRTLRHGGDLDLARNLAPLVEASLDTLLTHLNSDTLLEAGAPDWWDIGHVPGPRAYLSALGALAIEEGVELLRRAGRAPSDAGGMLATAAAMRRGLDKLWSEQRRWLFDRTPAGVDSHLYAGALVAVWSGALPPERSAALVATAEAELLDPALGPRNVVPMDFHRLEERYKLLPGEVGARGVYINGGVWPQNVAWLALAQAEVGRPAEAYSLLAKYLTPLGVAASPGGQASWYEYRISDPASPRYGAVDKPTFLWAGGWLLHSLYRLAGIVQSPWGLSVSPRAAPAFEASSFELALPGGRAEVLRGGQGPAFAAILVDGADWPSWVLPESARRIELLAGAVDRPWLTGIGARLLDAERGESELKLVVEGVQGQALRLELLAPSPALSVLLEGRPLPLRHETAPAGVVSRADAPLPGGRAELRVGFARP